MTHMVECRLAFITLLSVAFQAAPAWAQTVSETPEQKAQRMKWWTDARFGMFIHWGPVSLKGTEIGWSRGNPVPVDEYDNLYKQFNPTKFDAKEYVSLAKEAGMKYLTLVSKHHDGFCMYDSKYTDYTIMHGPFKRDIAGELAAECRRQGIRFCTYYSIIDWYQKDYLPRGAGDKRPVEGADYERYYAYMKNQLKELISKYAPLSVMWFDGEWERTWTVARGREIYAMLRQLQPDIIINNRLSKGRPMSGFAPAQSTVGDFATPEQTVGLFDPKRETYWESNMTICHQWAWKPNDTFKSLKQCIHLLVRNAGMDGNFMLNISPMPSGEIEPRQIHRLKEIGQWMIKYGQSIYGTRGGPYMPAGWGVSTCKDNVIYLHVLDRSAGETITFSPIEKKITSSAILTGGTVEVSQNDQQVRVRIPAAHRHEMDTIVALTLDGPALDIAPRLSHPGRSLAAGKRAGASNVFGDEPRHRADAAFDNDETTRWATNAGTKRSWLEVDLGRPMKIGEVRIVQEAPYGDRIRKFQIQYRDGDQWKTFLDGATLGTGYHREFAPITGQRVRLNILEASEGPTINEFQLYPPK